MYGVSADIADRAESDAEWRAYIDRKTWLDTAKRMSEDALMRADSTRRCYLSTLWVRIRT